MYKIEKQEYGLKLTFGGIIDATEMKQWLDNFREALTTSGDRFFVFVDMRTLVPLREEAQVHMREGQQLARQMGMERSVVILDSPVIAAQFRRIGWETGIGKWERYIDASSNPNWENAGMDWLLEAVDPATTESSAQAS